MLKGLPLNKGHVDIVETGFDLSVLLELLIYVLKEVFIGLVYIFGDLPFILKSYIKCGLIIIYQQLRHFSS